MAMVVCINPLCQKPENPHGTKFCQNCGNVIPDLLLNRFKIVKPIGQGAFGKTYLAEDSHKLDAACVVKQLIANNENNAKVLELFRREAEQLEKLGENNRIPQLIAYFQENNYLYLVQEYVQGEDLAAELESQGVWNEDKIRQLLGELLPVLQFIHDNGVVHRDLKPANIMRRHAGKALAKKGDLILIDFGVSKDLSGGVQQTRLGTLTGTPGYAPWEQMGFGKAYPASDLFSLGATCVHLLSNEYPHTLFNLYKGYGWTENYNKHIKQPISENLTQVLDKLLREKHSERYQSAKEVIQALEVSVPQKNIVSTMLSKTKVASHQNSRQNTVLSSLPVKAETQGKATAKPNKKLSLKTFEFETLTVEIIVKSSGFLGFGFKSTANYKKHQGQAKYFTENLGNGITLDMVAIPGGRFLMGTEDEEIERLVKKYDSSWFWQEKPQHQVTIKSFLMGKFQVTQAQWQAVANLPKINRELKPNPAYFPGNNRPVEKVSWYDALEFCARLSKFTGKEYTLPSEAQWEYACRAGTTTPFYFGETITSELANYRGNLTYANEPKGKNRKKTTPVGSFPPNAFGLYDMHGNVREFCADIYHDGYEGAPSDGSGWIDKVINNNSKLTRVIRGHSWNSLPWYCRSACRSLTDADNEFNFIGFRVVCVAETP